MSALGVIARCGEPLALEAVPVLSVSEFHDAVKAALSHGARVSAFFGRPGPSGRIVLTSVLARGEDGVLEYVSTEVTDSYPSLTPDCPQLHWFERELAEQYAIKPEGHPWLKPIRFHRPYRSPASGSPVLSGSAPEPGVTDYFRVEGESVHEVAVGPVHAGIIEPGHFRFQCDGEHVFSLEISLGYQHRGIEQALMGGPGPRTIHYMETLAGDTTIAHATCYAEAVEALSGHDASARAHAIRAIALELERLANHTGDLGALAGDVAYLPTASFCGRIRGDYLNMTALLCGSRFGRGLVRPGGVLFDLDGARACELADRLTAARRDVTTAVSLLWKTPSVLARFEETGVVSRETAAALGLVGVAARASGLERDARFDFPSGLYRVAHIPVCTWNSGDVFARAYVRWLEILRSTDFILSLLNALPAGDPLVPTAPLPSSSIVTTLVEAWRGEVCHVALTDAAGRFAHYKVVDPSFHNWAGLAMALRGQEISDFPLCNKSFNLSYCGHDL